MLIIGTRLVYLQKIRIISRFITMILTVLFLLSGYRIYLASKKLSDSKRIISVATKVDAHV